MNLMQIGELQHEIGLSTMVSAKDPIVKSSIDLATADGTWELRRDEGGHPLLTLRVRDRPAGEGSADFAPDELKNDVHLESRLEDLKSAVIQVGEWVGQVRALFDDMRRWCQNLPGSYVSDEEITVHERRSGEYHCRRLMIRRGNQSMRIEPVARWVTGADGRVDLIGTGGPFILVYEQDHRGWFHVQERYPAFLAPLTESLFLELAEACLDG